MPDLSDQLRDWAQSLADSVDPVDIDNVKSPVTAPIDGPGNRRWLAAAASIIVIAAATFAVATLPSDQPDQIIPATKPELVGATVPTATTATDTSPFSNPDAVPQRSTSPAATEPLAPTVPTTTVPEDRLAAWPPPPVPIPVDDIPHLLPTTEVAPGGAPVRGQTGGDIAAPATFTQVFADADRDILLTLQTQPGGVESTPAEMRQPIAIDGWDDAFLTAGPLRLVASDPGGFVTLTGSGINGDQAAALVASMERRPRGAPGWDLAGAFGDLIEINGAWNDSAGQRSVTWFDGDSIVAQMLTSPAHTDLISQALMPTFEQVDVNGTTGWLHPNDARRSIVWSPDGNTIVVLAVVDDRIDPLAIARSVTELTATEYESSTTAQVPATVGDGCDGSLFC